MFHLPNQRTPEKQSKRECWTVRIAKGLVHGWCKLLSTAWGIGQKNPFISWQHRLFDKRDPELRICTRVILIPDQRYFCNHSRRLISKSSMNFGTHHLKVWTAIRRSQPRSQARIFKHSCRSTTNQSTWSHNDWRISHRRTILRSRTRFRITTEVCYQQQHIVLIVENRSTDVARSRNQCIIGSTTSTVG